MILREPVGPCPICGAAHTACTAESGPIRVQQLPARDETARDAQPSPSLGDGSDGLPFSTGTYRGRKAK